jgi:hypothetical protein
VKEINLSNGVYQLKGIFDTTEDDIVDAIRQQKTNHESFPLKKIILKLMNDVWYNKNQVQTNAYHIVKLNTPHFFYCIQLFSNPYQEVITPPPQILI